MGRWAQNVSISPHPGDFMVRDGASMAKNTARPPGSQEMEALERRAWSHVAVRILSHDATLLSLVMALLVVCTGLVAAARRSTPALPVERVIAEEVAAALEVAVVTAEVRREPAPQPRNDRVTSGTIRRGESLSRSLMRNGVSAEAIRVIVQELSPHYDFRRSQPGHDYRLTQTEAGSILEFRYNTSPVQGYRMFRAGDGYTVQREQAVLTPRVVRLAGMVTETLHDAVRDLGEHSQLAADFSDIFAWDIDFSRSVQLGDEFRILYERLYRTDLDGNEVYVRPGRILAAHYQGRAGNHTAIYFESEEGRGGYYRPDGSSVRRRFLVAPLRYDRISSSFSSARKHPILNVMRPHHGIDYAAPIGTPLWSVADGKVIYRGWAGGFGNLVKIRHEGGYISYYAHLSRFAKHLKVGRQVSQKQVLGYVGKSGLATGPHVCFRIAKDGRYVDPTRLRTPSVDPVSAEVRHLFHANRDILLAELDAGPSYAEGRAASRRRAPAK